jgi:hypothetical protein
VICLFFNPLFICQSALHLACSPRDYIIGDNERAHNTVSPQLISNNNKSKQSKMIDNQIVGIDISAFLTLAASSEVCYVIDLCPKTESSRLVRRG